MPSVLSKLARTWTWFWSREYLGNGGTKPVRSGRSLTRYILSSEDLPEAESEPEPDEYTSGSRVGSLCRYVCQGESLPDTGPPASGPAPSFLGWLFSREHLPRAGGAEPEPDSQPNPES